VKKDEGAEKDCPHYSLMSGLTMKSLRSWKGKGTRRKGKAVVGEGGAKWGWRKGPRKLPTSWETLAYRPLPCVENGEEKSLGGW